MTELITAILGGCVGACAALIAFRSSMNNYMNLVEHLWNNDMKHINHRVDQLLVDRMKDNVVYFSTKSVNKTQ